MPFDNPIGNVLGPVSYYGSFAWMYGIKDELWNAATDSYVRNFNELKKPHLITLIDYSIPSNKPRLWTLNFNSPIPQLMFHTIVAHGKGSGRGKTVDRVSKKRGSNESTVGGFVTKHIYQSKLGQKDKTKKRPAMVIEGLDPSNDNARNRGIRVHGAHYVHKTRAGTSHGCICCRQEVHEALINVIHGGSFIFSYFDQKSLNP
ncbi:MAG: murein L,D-transpeptidase catalytic domain-containing protein [Pseudomonadota bacterium]